MDFSFEKTHSAYMLFYERDEKSRTSATFPAVDEMDPELASWIWKDNIQFIRDKQIFDLTYFNFIWLLCSNIALTFTDSSQTALSNVKLATSFLLETFIHSKEKPGLKGWSDLLLVHFEHSMDACQWFLDHMAEDNWWLHQILLRCPVQATRQVRTTSSSVQSVIRLLCVRSFVTLTTISTLVKFCTTFNMPKLACLFDWRNISVKLKKCLSCELVRDVPKTYRMTCRQHIKCQSGG